MFVILRKHQGARYDQSTH